MSSRINYEEAKRVRGLIDEIKAAGFTEAAEIFTNTYWGWLRTMDAYTDAFPYVANPEEMRANGIGTAAGALSVTNYTIAHWSPLIPGSPTLNEKEVLEEARRDAEWHRQEDKRMRNESDHLCGLRSRDDTARRILATRREMKQQRKEQR